MRLRFYPLFFLPRRALRWAYDQAYSEHLMDTPFVALFCVVDTIGIWFPYKGDEVLWLWPWKRDGKPPFISVGFTGTGAFGDAHFESLKEIDETWARYEQASIECAQRLSEDIDKMCVEMVTRPVQ